MDLSVEAAFGRPLAVATLPNGMNIAELVPRTNVDKVRDMRFRDLDRLLGGIDAEASDEFKLP